MTKELSGKIAFVTGSGRGLGRVMADRLAELGADVAIHDLNRTAPAKYGEARISTPSPRRSPAMAAGSWRSAATSATRRRSRR